MEALAVVQPQQRYGDAREKFDRMVRRLESKEALGMTHSDLERELDKEGRDLLRSLLQEHLDARSPGQSVEAVIGSDGIDRPRVRLQERHLETVFGTVTVHRAGYGQEGTESLHPLDAELNLPEEIYSLELRRRVAQEASKSSFDETVESIRRNTGGEVPKRQIEQLVVRAAQDFDAFYDRGDLQGEQEVQSGSLLILSVDGKGVVMRTEDLRDATKKAANARKHKLTTRLSKGEKRNGKRMATVAAVYTIAPFVRQPEDCLHPRSSLTIPEPRRPRPQNKRVWASLEKSPEEVIAQMFQEAEYRDPQHQRTWAVMVDGNKTQIRLLRKMARNKGMDLTIIVDLIHVMEYLWAAGRAFHLEGSEQLERWVLKRALEILRGNGSRVAGGMRRSATRRALPCAKRKAVDICARYLVTYSPYLNYHRYLAQGLPIATGVIEGACRHLVKDRMELTGARWSLSGAEAVLRLRALRASHDFDEYWIFHENREYERNHQSRYANGKVPLTTSNPLTHKRLRPRIVR
jgi:hypothetical protein